MRAGQLRHRVEIQQSTETLDAAGQATATWRSIHRVPASVTPLAGRELFDAIQVQANLTHRVTIRYLPGITSNLRVLFGDRILNIASVVNVEERNIQLDLLCFEAL